MNSLLNKTKKENHPGSSSSSSTTSHPSISSSSSIPTPHSHSLNEKNSLSDLDNLLKESIEQKIQQQKKKKQQNLNKNESSSSSSSSCSSSLSPPTSSLPSKFYTDNIYNTQVKALQISRYYSKPVEKILDIAVRCEGLHYYPYHRPNIFSIEEEKRKLLNIKKNKQSDEDNEEKEENEDDLFTLFPSFTSTDHLRYNVNLYNIFSSSSPLSISEIKKRYRALTLLLHPGNYFLLFLIFFLYFRLEFTFLFSFNLL